MVQQLKAGCIRSKTMDSLSTNPEVVGAGGLSIATMFLTFVPFVDSVNFFSFGSIILTWQIIDTGKKI